MNKIIRPNYGSLRYGTMPEPGDAAGLLAARDRLIDKLQTYRNRHMQRITRNYWYLLGRQHILGDTRLSIDGTRASVFRDIPSPRRNGLHNLMRSTSNYLAPAVEVEMAAQTKRQWEPNVLSDSDDPAIIAAAKVAKDVLLYDLERDHWPLIRDRFIHQTIVAGTGLLWSYWDESWNELSCIDPGEAVRCASCNAKYHSSSIDRAGLSQYYASGGSLGIPESNLKPTGMPGDDSFVSLQYSVCPKCAGSLNEYQLHPDELYERDPFGRELGLHVPKGYGHFENVAAHEFYPDSGGLNTTPENIRRFAIRKVRSLSQYVEQKYPDRMGEIEPDSPYDLMAAHPILGEWDYLARLELGMDHGIYDEHVFEDTIVELPTVRYDKGRLAVIIGDVICYDGDLVHEAQDGQGNSDSVPKHRIFAARYKERPDEFWGESLLDQQVSPQNRLNRIDMQEGQTMIRMGSPYILLPSDMDLTGTEYVPGYGAVKVLRYNASFARPDAKPETFGGQYFYAHFQAARQAAIDDIKQGVGPVDIEIGEAPKNIGTTSGLQVLGEQAERRRATRERSIISACEGAWSHRLQLLWCLRTNIEKESYTLKTKEGTWSQKQYTRLSIMGQTKVKIEKQAYIDRSIYQAESVREAMADSLYVVDSPQARKKILTLRGLPTNVNEDKNLQIDHAEKQASDFRSIRKIPVVDETLDDPILHYQTLGTELFKDDFKDIEEAVGWPDVVVKLAGWKDRISLLQEQEAISLEVYGSRLSPEQGAEAYARLYDAYDRESAAYNQQQAVIAKGVQIGQAPAAPAMPPSPPPKPFFLSPYMPTNILQVWTTMLQEQGYQPPPPEVGEEPPESIEKYLQFRAVYEAYRMMAEAAMAPAPGAGPAAPAPGPAGPGASSGTAPVPSPPGQQQV